MLRLPNAYFLFGALLAAELLFFSLGSTSVLGQQDDPFSKSKTSTADPFSAFEKPAPKDPFAQSRPSAGQSTTPAEEAFFDKESTNLRSDNAGSDWPRSTPLGGLKSQESDAALGKQTSEPNLSNGLNARQRASSTQPVVASSTPPLPTNLDKASVVERASGSTLGENSGIPELLSGVVSLETWNWGRNNGWWLLPVLLLVLLVPVRLIFKRFKPRGRRRYGSSDQSDAGVTGDKNVRKGFFKKSSRFSTAVPVDEKSLTLTAPESAPQDSDSFDFREDHSTDNSGTVKPRTESSLSIDDDDDDDDDVFDLGLDESYSLSKDTPSKTPEPEPTQKQRSSDASDELPRDGLEDGVVQQDQNAHGFQGLKARDVAESASRDALATGIVPHVNETGAASPQPDFLDEGNSKTLEIKNQMAEIAKLSSQLQLANETSERKVEDFKSKLQQISQEKTQFSNDAEALRQQLAEANEKTAELDSKLADANAQLSARKQSDVEAAQKAADAEKYQELADAKVEELKVEFEKLKGELAQSSQAESELTEKLKTATATAEQMESELVTAKEDVKLLQQEQRTRDTTLEKNQQEENRKLEKLNVQIDELKTELKGAQTANEQVRKELADAKEQSGLQKEENDRNSVKLEEQKSAQSRAFDELHEEVGALKIQIEDDAKEKAKLSRELDEAVAASQKAQADRSKALDDVTKTQDELAKTQSDLAEAQDKLTQSQTDLTEARKDLTESQADLAKTQTNLTEAETNLTEVQADLTSTRERLNDVQKAKSEVAAELEQQKHDQQKIVEDLNSQISSVKTDSTVDATVSAVKPADLKRAAKKLRREITVRKQTEKWLAQAEEQRTDIARDLLAVREELKKAKQGIAQQSSQNNSTDVVEENASLKKQLAESIQRQNALEQQLEKANRLNKQIRDSDRDLMADRNPVSQTKLGDDEWSQKLQEVQEELVTKKKA